MECWNIDDFKKSSQNRHPGEPARGLSASGGRTRAGVQNCLYFLDSGFRRNDTKYHFLNFYKGVNAGSRDKRALRDLNIPFFHFSIIPRVTG